MTNFPVAPTGSVLSTIPQEGRSLANIAKELDAMLFGTLLRATKFSDGLIPASSPQAGIFQDFITQHLATELAKGHQAGFGAMALAVASENRGVRNAR